ncbi:hypothetical protein LINPERHAP1_LOCUS8086, partial [Linum perenne]
NGFIYKLKKEQKVPLFSLFFNASNPLPLSLNPLIFFIFHLFSPFFSHKKKRTEQGNRTFFFLSPLPRRQHRATDMPPPPSSSNRSRRRHPQFVAADTSFRRCSSSPTAVKGIHHRRHPSRRICLRQSSRSFSRCRPIEIAADPSGLEAVAPSVEQKGAIVGL